MKPVKLVEEPAVASAEIWNNLTPEQRKPIIQLLVQMAYKVYMARREAEDCHDQTSETTQKLERDSGKNNRAE